MKETMIKQNLCKRLLALVMALIMVIGLIPNIATKAADATQVVFSSIDPTDTTNARLYVFAKATNTLTAGWTNYTPADNESGIWWGTTGDTSQDTKVNSGYSIAKTADLRYRINFNGGGAANDASNQAKVGDIITVEGTFAHSTGGSFVIEKTQFQYTESGWIVYIPSTGYDFTTYTFSVATNATSTADRLYLSVSQADTNDLVAYGNEFKGEDAASGIWLGTTGDIASDTKLGAVFRKDSDARYIIGGGSGGAIGAAVGQILTIQGTLTSNDIDIVMPKLQYQYTDAGWVVYVPSIPPVEVDAIPVVFDGVSAVESENKNAKRLYVTAAETNTLTAGWTYYYAADDASGIWFNDTKLTEGTAVTKISDKSYRIEFNGDSQAATAGDIITVEGTFTNDTHGSLKVDKTQFQYTNSGWTVYIPSVGYDFTNYAFSIATNATSTADRLYLSVAQTDTNDLVAYANEFGGADATSGIWLGTTGDIASDTKLGAVFRKDSDARYIIGGGSGGSIGATVGQILTIQGTFTANDIDVVMPTLQYQYTDAGWVVYVPSVPPVEVDPIAVVFDGVSAVESENTNAKRLYVTAAETNTLTAGWTYYYAADDASGVWFNDTKLTEGTAVTKISDKSYRIEFNGDSQAATAGDIITVEGTFISASNEGMKVGKTQFQYTGTRWTPYIPATYTDITFTGLDPSAAPEYRDGYWRFYAIPSKTVPGKAWSSKYLDVEVQIGNQTALVSADVAESTHGLYFRLPADALAYSIAADTKIVVKKGEYRLSSDMTKGIRITQDFTIYANKYGFSTEGFVKEIVAGMTNAKLELDLQTSYGGSENGIYLNTNDNFPVDKTWKTRIYAVTYDSGSGVFFNGEKINGTLCRYNNGKAYISLANCGIVAKDHDVVTVKGLFALGSQGVSYSEVSFYFNGKIWGTTYEPAKPETYKKVTAISVNPVTHWNEERDGWDVYLDLNAMLPGEIDVTKFEKLTVEVGGQTFETRVSHSHKHTLYFLLPGNYLASNVKDGVAVTLKAGRALAADKSTGIELTKDFTFYTFMGSMTERKPTTNTSWQDITITQMVRTVKFRETSKAWVFHVKLKEALNTESGTVFYKFPIGVNGKTYEVQAKQDGEYIYFTIPDTILPGSTKKATISIKAGASAIGNAGYNGIRVTEDWEAYIFNGVLSEQKFEETQRLETNIVGLQNVTEVETKYNVYIRTNREIPGTPWYEEYDDFVYYYNGQKINAIAKKSTSSNNKFLYFSIDKAVIGEPKEGDIVEIKPNTEMNCGGYQIAIMNQFMMIYSDGVWSQYMDSEVEAPEAAGSLWESMRFDSGYIPTTEDGSVLYAGADEYNTVSTTEHQKDYTMRFQVKKSIDDETTPPFRVILRGTPVSETEPMTYSLLNGYVITFSTTEVKNAEGDEEDITYGAYLHLWKNGENNALMDQYRLSYVYATTDHPFYQNDVYYDFEISIYNVTETCVCIMVKVNDKLIMRYYDEAGSDLFDPAINSGTFAIQAISPMTIQDDIVNLDSVIAEADECQAGDKIRVAATYPSVIKGAEFTVDSKNATVEDGIFKAEKAGTYTISCTYEGKELSPKVIKVVEAEAEEVIAEKNFPIVPVAVAAIVVAAIGTAGFFFVKKRKSMKKEEA